MGYLHGLARTARLALWLRSAAWLALLGPFFFLSYNAANQWTAAHGGAGTIWFSWERSIPFLDWSIVPYWSLDLAYPLSFLWCRTRREVDAHGGRLLLLQVVSVAFFILFPLRIAWPEPSPGAPWQPWFDALHSFDLPYNEAPSLHVGIAYVLARRMRNRWAVLWMAVSAAAALTTWQHQVIDVATGVWAAIVVEAVLAEEPRPQCRRPRLSLFYFGGAALFGVAAFSLRGWAWTLLWPSFALTIVGAAYLSGRVETLGKRRARMPLRLAPYWVFAWLHSRIRAHPPSEVIPGIWVGGPAPGYASVVDLTGELPVRAARHVPMLDLAPPTVEQIQSAVAAIEAEAPNHPLLVCCALGLSRSAAATAAWLVHSGAEADIDSAVERIRHARPAVVISNRLRERLRQWADTRNG